MAKMICEKCGFVWDDNTPGACRNCGSGPLQPLDQTGQEAAKGAVSDFIPERHAEARAAARAPASSMRQRKTHRILVLAISFSLVLMAFLGYFFISAFVRLQPRVKAAPQMSAEQAEKVSGEALSSADAAFVLEKFKKLPANAANRQQVVDHLIELCLQSEDQKVISESLTVLPYGAVGMDELRFYLRALKENSTSPKLYKELAHIDNAAGPYGDRNSIYFVYSKLRGTMSLLKIANEYKRAFGTEGGQFEIYFFDDERAAARKLPLDDAALLCWTALYKFSPGNKEYRLEPVNMEAVRAGINEKKRRDRDFLESRAGEIWSRHPEWPREVCEDIAKGEVALGYSERQCLEAWGKPNSVSDEDMGDYYRRRWCYGNGCQRSLCFVDGVLTRVQR